MSSVASYLALTKPRLLPLVLLTGLPAMVLAADGWPAASLVAMTLLATAVAAGAANALNCYVERDRDARMERTRLRPLPAGRLPPASALAFGLVLTLLGTGLLTVWAGTLAALIALGAILLYVFVYTLWLKPRTPFAVVLGGVTGAIVPLIGDAAGDGYVGAAGWLLFSIILIWQLPHFYAISLYRSRDYAAAGFPMLADRIGEEATRARIVAWSAVLVPLTLAGPWLTLLGAPYAVAAALLGAWFLWTAIRLYRECDDDAARRFFRTSLVYLGCLFLAMLVDVVWTGLAA